MKKDDLDVALDNLKVALEQIDSKKIEEFLIDNNSENWAILKEQEKKHRVNLIKEYLNNYKNRQSIQKLQESLRFYASKRFDLIILFLGVLLGIGGNLLANMIEKYFVYLGFYYNIAVVIIFLFTLGYVYVIFIKKPEEEIMSEKTTIDLLSIMEKIGIR